MNRTSNHTQKRLVFNRRTHPRTLSWIMAGIEAHAWEFICLTTEWRL